MSDAPSDRFQAGAAVLEKLFGVAPKPSDDEFMRITIENLFGDVWTREGLELRERSMITVTALTVLGREAELELHLRGALNVGVSRETILEMMLHLAHYGGWPVAVSGLRVARKVFQRADETS